VDWAATAPKTRFGAETANNRLRKEGASVSAIDPDDDPGVTGPSACRRKARSLPQRLSQCSDLRPPSWPARFQAGLDALERFGIRLDDRPQASVLT